MKKKLMSYILGTLLFILIIVSTLFTSIFNHQYEESVKDNLRVNNELVKKILLNRKEDHVKVLKESEFENLPIRITYIDKEGNVLFDTDVQHSAMENHNSREEVIEARENSEGYSIRYSETIEKNMMYFASVFEEEYIIRSSLPLNSINIFNDIYFKYYLLVLIAIILLSIWFSNKLSYIIVKPIIDLDFITSRIARGELHRRVKVISEDEVGKLGRNFNYMADRLESTLNEVMDKQNRLEAILKSMDSGIIAIDRNYKVIMINPYSEKIFGINKDIIGENLLDNIREHELEDIFTGDINEYKELKIFWPEERELRIKTADIINRNEHIGTVAVVQDITDIKRLENMRSQFVANVSHELKTPLTSIKGFSETLKEVEEPEIRNKFLNIINDEAERLTRLINDILTLSHIEQKIEISKEEVDVKTIIFDVYNLIKSSAEKKNISINVKCEEVPNLLGDSDRFKQMMINLVDNAVKYSENGDKVFIEAKAENNKCIIKVEDTGVGIDKEQIPRLFERFYRVDKARSRAKGGTGLGLAIVKHILKLFKGKIEVESELGVGSKFKVTIPYKKN